MRITVFLVLFFLFFNGGAVFLDTTGGDELLGVNAPEEQPDELRTANQSASEVSPGSGGGQTLFSLYNSIGSTLEVIVNAISPGAVMIKRAGVPDSLVNYGFVAMPVIVGLDLIAFFRNTEMIS